MPADGSVFDGFTSIVAQDADTHPSYLPPSMVAESVNRTFRGGINRTRPSIRNIPIVAGEGQDEIIVNYYEPLKNAWNRFRVSKQKTEQRWKLFGKYRTRNKRRHLCSRKYKEI